MKTVYQLLLYLYPASFRAEYGLELQQVFESMLQHESALKVWARVLPDLYWNAGLMRGDFFLKRMFDLTIATTALLILLPIFPIIAVWIKRDSAGSVLYLDPRIGKNGKPFAMLKFRTMAERDGIKEITWAGAILRRFQLDELTQFWNVLKGEMSIIGPRPTQTASTRHLKPGMTGLAQIQRQRGEAVNEDLEQQYLYQRSFVYDVRLFWQQIKLFIRQIY